MKKLYRKGAVHPSPPIISDHLSFLPAAILTLTAALSSEDREVLAYLISCASNNNSNNIISVDGFQGQRKNNVQQSQQKSVSFARSRSSSGNGNNNNDHNHPPLFTCDCFRCYMSYWVRWDSSPNRQLIHEIIDAFEDELLRKNDKKVKNNKKDKKKRGGNDNNSGELRRKNNIINHHEQSSPGKEHHSSTGSESAQEINRGDGGDHHHHEGCKEGDDQKKGSGSVRNFIGFIGEKIWGVWG